MSQAPAPQADRSADAIVVGGGPVGFTLALLLAQLQRRVVLLERWPAPYALPRAVAISHDNRRVFASVGLGEAVDAMVEPWGMPGDTFTFEDADGGRLMTMQWSLESVSGFPLMSGFSQPDLEAALEAAAEASPLIDVRRGTSFVSFEETADGVVVTTERYDALGVVADGEHATLTAAYLVGCDGANSLVREQLGFEMDDLDFQHDWLVVDVKMDDYPEHLPYGTQHLDPARPTSLVPSGPRRRRWEFMVMPGDDPATVDTDEKAWELLAAWGVTPGNAELVRHALYTFRARWARRWYAGRVALAGDAAHLTPPFFGQGFNSGIRDAADLAWRLDALIGGWAGPALLADYEVERRDQMARIIGETVRSGQLICIDDPAKAAIRDERMRKHAFDVREGVAHWPLVGGTQRDDDASGELLPRARVRANGAVLPIDDALPAQRLLLLGRGPLDLGPDVDAWRATGGVTAVVGTDFDDVDGTLLGWLSELGAYAVLVRPDHVVYGAAASARDVAPLVHDLLTALRTERTH